ncbi:jg26758 [Pararge aegeria aegeria]|uniref:Jg26758 protein n=1 Tax=Pararge aegeria aegeria TaxID=348720 RepID=A0A8S4RP58_9NEOP|nr:jg26758 [Pararge aegeria aegeria]
MRRRSGRRGRDAAPRLRPALVGALVLAGASLMRLRRLYAGDGPASKQRFTEYARGSPYRVLICLHRSEEWC